MRKKNKFSLYPFVTMGILSMLLLTASLFAQTPSGFKDNGDGTVTDKKTGLTWQKVCPKEVKTWHGAGKYCHTLSLAGHSDWRLPTKNELVSLYTDGGFRSKESSFYWSSETDPGTAVFGDPLAWIVSFKDGEVSHAPTSDSNTDYLNYVRAVHR